MSKKINADKENTIQILDYGFLMEFLNQQSISALKEKEKKANIYKRDLSLGSIKRPKKVVEDVVTFKIGDSYKISRRLLPKKCRFLCGVILQYLLAP